MGIGSWLVEANAAGRSRFVMAYVVSGYCAMLAVVLSLWLVWPPAPGQPSLPTTSGLLSGGYIVSPLCSAQGLDWQGSLFGLQQIPWQPPRRSHILYKM